MKTKLWRIMSAIVVATGLLACSGSKGDGAADTPAVPTDAGRVQDVAVPEVVEATAEPTDGPDLTEVATPDTHEVVSIAWSVGEDLDSREVLLFGSGYALPQTFYDALEQMGVPLAKLAWSDLGLTADWDTTRLHWTDTIRHEGHKAPELGYMVVEDVTAALELLAGDQNMSLLVSAQYKYMDRFEFVSSRFDTRITVEEQPYPLLHALEQFYEHPGVPGHPNPSETPWPVVENNLAQAVLQLPLEARIALAQAVLGLLKSADMRNEALVGSAKVDWDGWAKHQSDFLKGAGVYAADVQQGPYSAFDYELMNRAAQLAVRSLESLRLALQGIEPVEGVHFELLGALGVIAVDFGTEDNQWKMPEGFLVVDRGGDDTWLGRNASNYNIYHPIAALLDMEGDDVYRTIEEWEVGQAALLGPRKPMLGAGIYGIAILSDHSGNDHYRCPRACEGFGVFGAGVLLDSGGDDEYVGYEHAQGSSELGYGLLVDRGEGVDRYETLQFGQGYAGPRAMGWLVDDGGDDNYLAIKDPMVFNWAGEGHNFSGSQGFAFGFRGGPYWSGGLGALLDLKGDDVYQCSVMCLGFGYFFGTGLVWDGDGDDSYEITHKYGLGSATHQSVGLFFDDSGADKYRISGNDEAIGLGYDHGVAFHLDRGDGDDVYTVDNYGEFVIGFARHPAMGVLINEGGNDEYHIPGPGDRSLGRTEVNPGDRDGFLAGFITVGMFLDLGGDQDVYDVADRPDVTNGSQWIQTEPLGGAWEPELDFGLGWDLE